MKMTVIGVFLGVCSGAFYTVALVPPAVAAPRTSTSEACDGDDPMPCLNRHGEAAAKALSLTYADLANNLDTACTQVPSPGMSACLERAQQNADKELNEAYTRAIKSIDKDDTGRKWRERLRLAQQAWLHFRDADCGDLTTSEWSGGTGMGAAIITCQLGHTEARTAELNRRYVNK
jgi:uncharacterized protein YecT (DUF1311 family)